MKAPHAYPHSFHRALEAGGSLILAENLPWTTKSARNRFYGFLGAVRASAEHPLRAQAELPWTVTATENALVISLRPRNKRSQPRTEIGADARQVLKTLLDKGAPGG